MLLNTAVALRDLGHEPHVVCPRAPDELAKAAGDAGLAVTTIRGGDDWRYLARLRVWALRHRRELKWCQGLRPGLALAGHSRRFVHLHQIPDGVHRGAVLVARWRASQVLLPSEVAAAGVKGAYPLRNWTSPAPPESGGATTGTDPVDRPRPPFTFGYLGRISAEKGVRVLLEAFSIVRHGHSGVRSVQLMVAGEPRFTTAGDGADLLAAVTSAPGVTAVGWSNAHHFLGAVDALVVPSVSPESFGLVAAEAMAAEVPVIATDAGALPEVVGPDHPLLTPAGSSRALAESMRQILEMSRDERAGLAALQYERWQRLWSPEAGRQRVAHLMASLPCEHTAQTKGATA